MSKVGKVPVSLPKDVQVTIDGSALKMKGSKGELSFDIPHGTKVEQKDDSLVVTRLSDAKQHRANHGTVRAVLQNMIVGVTEGHKKELEIQGVGFRGQAKGKQIELNLGLSHSVTFDIPEGVKVSVPKPTEITIEGVDKAFVGLVAAKIRDIKPPEPYKGKGIRYVGEIIKRKQGKSISK